jgi:orotidine-5'-phosphate decarboxylase
MYAAAQLAVSDMSEDTTPHGEKPPSAVVLEDATPLAVTVSGYFGLDGVKPFIDVAVSQGKGLFVLVRTSNPSAAAIQDVPLADGRKLHDQVAAEVARWAGDPRTHGASGYSNVGAVVATRNQADAAKLRAAMPRCFLLVPGYGAQGGTADDFRSYFNRDGLGALVVAGRSVIFAYDRPEYRAAASWEDAVKAACQDFVRDLARVVTPI